MHCKRDFSTPIYSFILNLLKSLLKIPISGVVQQTNPPFEASAIHMGFG